MKEAVGRDVPFATGMKPVSKPVGVIPSGPISFLHGCANDDWVTVWFLASNVNLI